MRAVGLMVSRPPCAAKRATPRGVPRSTACAWEKAGVQARLYGLREPYNPGRRQAAELLAGAEELAEAGSFLVEVVVPESEPPESPELLEPEETEEPEEAAEPLDVELPVDERLSVR